jgi:imidazolonepropionase-like amidohydrolase
MYPRIFAFFTLFFLCSNLIAQEKIALLCGQIITGKDEAPILNRMILVEGERILGITEIGTLPEGYQLIDLSEYTVLPGLIDAHVHPLIYGDDYQINHLKGSSAFNALRGLKTVQDWLREGWTTLRVAGDADVEYAHFEIRNAINRGVFEGPRIFGAGHYLSVTGGGGDINFLAPDQELIPDGLIVNGPDEVRKAIRQEIKYGSDWIKLLVTGAFMSSGDNPQSVHFSDAELKAAMEEAGQRGIPVMAHAHSTEGIKKAIRAGARSIEHGTFLDEECIDLFLEYGTYLIPTKAVGMYILEEASESENLSKAYQLHVKYKESTQKMLARAIARGVKVGVGSDNVGFPPNFAAREFRYLTELGMSPMQAIQAGTKVNAELLGQEANLGTLEKGKYADIIATKENPLEDISELTRVRFVMKGGKVVKSLSEN